MGEVTHAEGQSPHLSQAVRFQSQKQQASSPGLSPRTEAIASLVLFPHHEVPKGCGQPVFKASQAAHSTKGGTSLGSKVHSFLYLVLSPSLFP